MPRHRILIVEDEHDIAGLIKHTLEGSGEAEAEIVGSGDAALKAVTDRAPDLIILDLNLPVIGGLEVCRILRSRADVPHVPIIMLTARTTEDDRVTGLEHGADDYVTKPFGVLELLERVGALLRRAGERVGGGTRATTIRFGDVVVDTASRAVTRSGAPCTLTPKEFELLLALIRRGGAVAGRVELLTEVWGYGAFVLSRTVDSHVAELRRKLEADPARPRHILTVWKIGYRFDAA